MTTTGNLRVKLYPLLSSLISATDLVSPILVAHHRRVAFITASLGLALGVPAGALQEATMAAAVHDIGGLSLRQRLDSFEFEVLEPRRHTLPGYVLLNTFPPFAGLARLVRYHHQPWQDGRGSEDQGEPVPTLSHLIHLADRIAVRITPEPEILSQREEIVAAIAAGAGAAFIPEQVEAFRAVVAREAFWFDLTSPEINEILQARLPLGEMELSHQELPELAELFRKIIDFRSRFTATHSSGVAAVGVALAEKSGLGREFTEQMGLAGLLHDIGKLVVPAEILSKHTPLTALDFAAIRKHPYYSAWILRNLEGFEQISQWAAYHHERLDGSGYPYHQAERDLPAGAKILAVADTFTALTEDRPYRCSMSGSGSDQILLTMADHRKLDHHCVSLLHDHLEEFDHLRRTAQAAADATHQQFLADCRLLDRDLDPEDYCPGHRVPDPAKSS